MEKKISYRPVEDHRTLKPQTKRRRMDELWPDGALEKPVQVTGAEGANAGRKTECAKLSGKRTEKMDGAVAPSVDFKGAKQCLCSFFYPDCSDVRTAGRPGRIFDEERKEDMHVY